MRVRGGIRKADVSIKKVALLSKDNSLVIMGRRSKRLRTVGAEGNDSVKKNIEAKKKALVRTKRK